MDAQGLLGDWIICVGAPRTPLRRIGLTENGAIFNFNGDEKFWAYNAPFLLLMDADRTIVSIFDTSTLTNGGIRGAPRQLGFIDSQLWLIRPEQLWNTPSGPILPMQVGPLDLQANDPETFAGAWSSGEDFSVVLTMGHGLKARGATPYSRNMGTSESSKRFEISVNQNAPNGYTVMPAFFHVLHDCLLIDGALVVTRDGKVIHETTQFPGLEPLWDTDFGLKGSTINALVQDITVGNQIPITTFDFPIFLLSTLKYGYGHFLGQSVSNALFIDWIRTAAPELADQLVLAMLGGIANERFRADSLRMLDLKNPVLAPPKGVVRCKTLVVPSFHRSHSHHWEGIGPVFRKMAVNARKLSPDAPQPKRLYASRSGQARGFTDDGAINKVLDKYGFTPLVGGTIPFIDQVAMYGGAEAVFGIYGSNMCNISFCPEEALVVETFDEMHVDPLWEYFLANASKLNFCYLITPVSEAQQALGFGGRTVDLDPEILDAALQEGLGK